MPRRIFFTADTHFGHRGIIEHCNRPFATTEEMDNTLIANWNSLVGSDDDVWHLGDFAWSKHAEYLARLNGNIRLVLGNHDKMSAAAKACFTKTCELFTGRVSGNRDLPKFFLFHYPMVSWPSKSFHHDAGGTIHLYGHVHGRYTREGEPSMDVGVDTHNFFPYTMEEVLSTIERKRETSTRLKLVDTETTTTLHEEHDDQQSQDAKPR